VRLTLLSRAWCHLCDEMIDALLPLAAVHGAQVSVIDVDDPAHAALGTVWGDDPESRNELCRHRLDAGRVAAALADAE